MPQADTWRVTATRPTVQSEGAGSNSRCLAGPFILPTALCGGYRGSTFSQMRRLRHRVAPSLVAAPPPLLLSQPETLLGPAQSAPHPWQGFAEPWTAVQPPGRRGLVASGTAIPAPPLLST